MSRIGNPLSRRYVGDRRLLLVLPRLLSLQVGHPVIAAGVAEHSTFRTDPWGRLDGTVSKLLAATYGPDPAGVAGEIRKTHKQIKGVDASGRRYHALDPEAYFWVLATTIESIVIMAERFARPMTDDEQASFYDEWRDLGRMLGLRDRDMPETWTAFRRYYATMLNDRIEHNEVVEQVFDVLARPASPPGLPLPSLVWLGASRPAGHLLKLASVGTLPQVVRRRWGLGWSGVHDRQLQLMASVIRSGMRVLPREARYLNGATGVRPATTDGEVLTA